MKFSIKGFFSKCNRVSSVNVAKSAKTAGLVKFTNEILKWKVLCSGASKHLFIFLELMLEKADIDMDDIPEKLVKNERA